MTTTRRPSFISAAALVLTAFALFPSVVSAATPILEYNFNGDTASSGSLPTALTLQNSAVVSGAGASGSVGDNALNLTAATGMGNLGSAGGPSGFIDSRPTEINAMSSFTIQGWFKTESVAINGNANLMTLSGPITLNAQNSGRLTLTVDGANTQSATGGYNAVSTWTFFAVTYDGTLTSANVKFYVGNTSSAVTQLGTTATINSGSVGSTTATTDLVFGNSNGRDRAFDGFLDNLRLFGATSGAGGVLSLSELEALRTADITVIPEPASFASFVAGVVGIMALTRRGSRPSAF